MGLQIWDTAGQERFHSMTASHYRDADVIILCYECGDIESYNNCQRVWKTQIDDNAKSNVIVLIIGCKNDQRNGRELYVKLTTNIRNGQWSQYKTWCCQCSAKTGYNVTNIFEHAAEMVLQQMETSGGFNKYEHGIQLSQNMGQNQNGS